jgi:uroporphyrinogen decarboxylase
VFAATTAMLDAMPDKSRLIVSCGGGMPPGVSTANVNAFIDAVRQHPGSKA